MKKGKRVVAKKFYTISQLLPNEKDKMRQWTNEESKKRKMDRNMIDMITEERERMHIVRDTSRVWFTFVAFIFTYLFTVGLLHTHQLTSLPFSTSFVPSILSLSLSLFPPPSKVYALSTLCWTRVANLDFRIAIEGFDVNKISCCLFW